MIKDTWDGRNATSIVVVVRNDVESERTKSRLIIFSEDVKVNEYICMALFLHDSMIKIEAISTSQMTKSHGECYSKVVQKLLVAS